jgi:methionyl-tRNA formyltransferase
MKLVVMSYSNVLTAQVFSAIHKRHAISAVINIEWEPAPIRESRLAQLFKQPVATLRQKLDQRVDKWQHQRQMEKIADFFSGQQTSMPDVPTYTIGSRHLHTPASLELISTLSPDILLVTHAPILKPVLYNLPSIATLNVHWGIAPHYCGQHTFFWPLYHRDYARLGITIHRIDDGIDTGPIVAQGSPSIEPDDNEPLIWARCASVVSELVSSVLDAAQAGDLLLGWRSTDAPRQFRRRDRSALHTLRYWTRRKLLGERLPKLAAKKQLYLQPASAGTLLTALWCPVF